ncbi:MAG TPA: hypothetical protein VHP30_05395, partial [Ignavibacteriales bacterium]|nr:hypothetical protein [Ignavibacteriales bacterium]
MFSDGLYKSVASHIRKKKTLYFLAALILSACAVRLWFYSGLIFSDDAYYDQLAFSLYNGEYAQDYIGYPGFLLRILNHFLTAVSFFIFGASEPASVIPSFIFSVLTIPLIYKTSLALNSGVRGASVAAFLWAFFPLDIIFATFNFAEPKCALLLNLGAYLLLKSE